MSVEAIDASIASVYKLDLRRFSHLSTMHRILLTDYAWSDLAIEQGILQDAGVELVVAEQSDAESLARLAPSCDGIMTTWAKVPESVIAAMPRCKIVARLGIGLDNIDVTAATERGIPVTNVPDYCTTEVAEHALGLILALGRKVAFYHHETKCGRYNLKDGAVLRRLEGQKLGIVGLGNIGSKLAAKAAALGMEICATGRSSQPPRRLLPAVSWRSLKELLQDCDYISLHAPLSPETRHMIGREQFEQMKSTAYLINTARGGLIDHAALAAALQANQIAGAALDVQDPEPPDLRQSPYNDPRVIVTPHAAFVSSESLASLRSRVALQVVARLRGEQPENVVNPSVFS